MRAMGARIDVTAVRLDGPATLVTDITYMGRPARVACDRACTKAWGVGSRPRVQLTDDPDDYAFLADHELGDAPADTGTYEGGQGKPMFPDRHNKWCARECERSTIGDPSRPAALPDLSSRLFNIPRKDTANAR